MFNDRQKRDVERLAGRRGDKEQRAVLWNQVDALADKVAVKLASSRFGAMLGPYIKNVPIDEDKLERLIRISPTSRSISLRIEQETREVNQRIDVAQTFIDNLIEDFTLALPDLDTAIQTVATDAQAEIDLARQEATDALDAVVGGYVGTLNDLDASIDSVETNLTASINGVSADLDANYYTIAQADSAITVATTALKSEIEDPLGTSLGATLESNYYTAVETDGAISAAQTILQTNIDGVSADLTAEQVARSSADSAIISDVTDLTTRMGTAETDITNEQIARSSADSALASDITTLTTRVTDAEGDISSVSSDLSLNYYTNAQTDSAISSATTTLKSEIEDPNGTSLGATLENEYYTVLETDSAISSVQTSLQSNIDGVAADLTSEQTARNTADSALASDITSLTTRVGDAEAAITTEQTTRSDADNALSQDISTVSANLAAAEANVTQNASAIATIESYQAATYTLRVDAGDAEGSLEIVASDDPINGPASVVRIKADKLLFDGSVLAQHIDTESLATDVGFIGNLTVDELNIAGESITSEKLALRAHGLTAFERQVGNNVSEPTVFQTNLVQGTKYQIRSVGVSDFTAYGAESNTVGLEFYAEMDGPGGTVPFNDGVCKQAYQKAVEINIPTDVSAKVVVFWSFEQGFSGNGPRWGYLLKHIKASDVEAGSVADPVTTGRNQEVYDAYVEVLNRQPDQGGFDFYTTGGGAGVAIDALKNALLQSTEHKNSILKARSEANAVVDQVSSQWDIDLTANANAPHKIVLGWHGISSGGATVEAAGALASITLKRV